MYLLIGYFQFELLGQGRILSVTRLWEEVDESKPLALVFYSSECPIASRYVPFLERTGQSEEYGERAQLFLVFSNQDDDEARVAAYLKKMDISLPSVLDGEAALAKRLEAEVTPELAVLVVEAGEWRMIYRGKIDDRYEELGRFRAKAKLNYLEQALDAALAGDTFGLENTRAVGCYIYNDRLKAHAEVR